MPLRFLMDENLRGGALWHAILRHNARSAIPLDVLRVGDMAELPVGSADPDILDWAERNNRILVSLDRQTMPGFVTAHLRAGRNTPGVILVRLRTTVREVLDHLLFFDAVDDPAWFRDQVVYIP
jgi:hypothetical protein